MNGSKGQKTKDGGDPKYSNQSRLVSRMDVILVVTRQRSACGGAQDEKESQKIWYKTRTSKRNCVRGRDKKLLRNNCPLWTPNRSSYSTVYGCGLASSERPHARRKARKNRTSRRRRIFAREGDAAVGTAGTGGRNRCISHDMRLARHGTKGRVGGS